MKLATPIAAQGQRAHPACAGTSTWSPTRAGRKVRSTETTYFLGLLLPRVTNYSDYNGWDVSPFTMGREFNNDFADFQVEVEAPRDYVVWATGTLQNPAEVLQPECNAGWRRATRATRSSFWPKPPTSRPARSTARGERLVWKWQGRQVPDFAVALSNHYRWDAASTVVDAASGRRASVQAAYPDSATDFKPMVATAQKGAAVRVQHLSGRAVPLPKTTIVLGSADEEYPMMVNDSSNVGSAYAATLPRTPSPASWPRTRSCTAGSRSTWASTRSAIRSWTRAGPPPSSTCATARCWACPPPTGCSRTSARPRWPRPHELRTAIVTPHDALWAQAPIFGHNQYGKAALGYLALKDLMGDAAFRTALHTFMARWNGKRPLPWDMFNSFNDAGVGNYDWFFRNWFFSYNHMDLAVDGVRSAGGVPGPWLCATPAAWAVPFDWC